MRGEIFAGTRFVVLISHKSDICKFAFVQCEGEKSWLLDICEMCTISGGRISRKSDVCKFAGGMFALLDIDFVLI